MKNRISVFRNGALVAGSLILTLFAAEFMLLPAKLRSYGIPDREMYLVGLSALPGTQIDDTRINAQGYTGAILDKRKSSKNAVRIITLGGSALFNRRMTDRMIAAFSAVSETPVEIQGGALRGHTTRSSLLKYRYHFSKYEHDFVLIYHGINDLYANHVPPRLFRDDYSHMLPWYKRNMLLDHSIIAREVYNRWIWKGVPFVYPTPAMENQSVFRSAVTFERNLRELIEQINRNGAAPVLMTFAWYIPTDYSLVNFRKGQAGYNNPERYDPCPVELWGSPRYVREGLARHNAVIRRLATELRVPLIDQERLLSRNKLFFGDPCHFSDIGTDAFIEHVAAFFIERRFISP